MQFERTEAQMKAMAEIERRQAEDLEAGRELCERIGLTLICPENACRRARRCNGAPGHNTFGMPPCLMHYREEMRFLFIGPDDVLGEVMREKRGDSAEPPTEPPAETLIELLYGKDPETLERLRRPKGVRGPGTWQNDPEGFERYMDEGDWRNPGRLARPEPVNYYGRWVE